MGYGGSVKAMLDSLKNNKMLLRRKSTFTILKEQRKKTEESNLLKGKQIKNQPLSPELKEKLKKAAQQRIKKERYLNLLSILISIIVITVAIYIFIPSPSKTEMTHKEKIDYEEKRREFEFYINDGFNWLKKKHYNNAIFQFKLASKMKPNNIQARLGLTAAYAGSCKKSNENCDKAEIEFISFSNDFDDDKSDAWLYDYLNSIGDTVKSKRLVSN